MLHLAGKASIRRRPVNSATRASPEVKRMHSLGRPVAQIDFCLSCSLATYCFTALKPAALIC